MKTFGLALGSGGSRGTSHIGLLQALEEEGLRPDYLCGCSMGAVVGAAYASGMTPAEIWRVLGKLRMSRLVSLRRKRGGLFGVRKLKKLLKKHFGERTFAQLKIPFRCVAVDMHTQQIVEISEGSLVDGVLASISVPPVFPPQERENMRLIDGGILERVPVRQVKAMGADVTVAVDVLGWQNCQKKCPRVLGMLLDSLALMDNHRTKRLREDTEAITDFWLEPDLGEMSQYKWKETAFAYERGYALGKEYAPKIKRALEE